MRAMRRTQKKVLCVDMRSRGIHERADGMDDRGPRNSLGRRHDLTVTDAEGDVRAAKAAR